MAVPSPWHQLEPEQLDHHGHDPRTCPICAPMLTEAAARGMAAAREDAARAESEAAARGMAAAREDAARAEAAR